ncbi:DUF333 domain-containing protein [Candidatus Woesearchaeota archaeon]|nr:DUF333 domain-containing protein [Candidatus Woesearchaeota archaeon]
MKREIVLISISISISILVISFLGCSSQSGQDLRQVQAQEQDEQEHSPQQQASQIANPASVHCQEMGGTLEIRTIEDGSQAGYCTLPDGTECEEWAFYRGECP